MIKSIKVTNYLGDVLSLDLSDPEPSDFLVTGVDGITPLKANINVSDITTNDGGIFNSARVGIRNITMKLLYNPNPIIEETRHISYKYFPVKQKVTLEFETETRKAKIDGYVESNDMTIFTKQEFSSISIICPDPYFYSTEKDGIIDTDFATTEPRFRFSFPSKSDIAPDLLMGDIKTYREKLIVYKGDSEMGLNITIKANATTGNIMFSNRITGETMTIYSDKVEAITGTAIGKNDQIYISTYKGEKRVLLIRAGVVTNILNALDRSSTWIQIRPGDNVFAITSTDPDGAEKLETRVKTQVIYEGL